MSKFIFIAAVCFIIQASAGAVTFSVDPVSRDVLIRYHVPLNADQTVVVTCEYATDGNQPFLPAKVRKYRSLTAENILSSNPFYKDVIKDEMSYGKVYEHLAAGLERTLVWQASSQLKPDKLNHISLKVVVKNTSGNLLLDETCKGQIDFSDVIMISDFSKVLQQDELSIGKREGPGWYWIKPNDGEMYGILKCGKSCFSLNPLTLRPKLKGYYAIYVALTYVNNGCISLRLSDELYNQVFSASDPRESFWKIADMTGRNIILSQWDSALDTNRTGLIYLRLVPVNKNVYETSKRYDQYNRDKLVGAFTEPFSWAAYSNVTDNTKYAEPLYAFRDAKVDWLDVQMGRLGMRPVFPTLLDDPIVEGSERETRPGTQKVKQSGSALLSMCTDAFTATKVFSEAFNIKWSANFGAGIAYKGELRSKWAHDNPQYLLADIWPQYKYQEVRDEILSYFKEFLDKGAKRISIDFCRYPNVIAEDDDKTATIFLQELRSVADHYSTAQDRVKILVRFPVAGVRGRGCNYDPAQWVRQRLVDVIVPSGDCGNVNYFDVTEYVKMVRNTQIKCLPCIDLLSSAPCFPGDFIRRVDQLYDNGCDGIYLYQTEPMVIGWVSGEGAWARSLISVLGSSQAVKELVRESQKKDTEFSRDIYMHYPQEYSNRRVRIWIEGFHPEEVKTYIDGKIMNTFGPDEMFYRIGDDGWKHNYTVDKDSSIMSVKARYKNNVFVRECPVRIYKVRD